MFLSHQTKSPYLIEMTSPLLGDMAIHHFDAVRAVTGLAPVSVYALESRATGSWLPGAAAAVCSWRLAGGAVFSYGARGRRRASARATKALAHLRHPRRGDVGRRANGRAQARGGVPARSPTTRCTRRRRSTSRRPSTFGHTAALEAMLGALDRGEPAETSAEATVPSVAMMCAAIRSAAEDRVVTIEELLSVG